LEHRTETFLFEAGVPRGPKALHRLGVWANTAFLVRLLSNIEEQFIPLGY